MKRSPFISAGILGALAVASLRYSSDDLTLVRDDPARNEPPPDPAVFAELDKSVPDERRIRLAQEKRARKAAKLLAAKAKGAIL